MLHAAEKRLVEPFNVADVFVTGLGEIEDAGGGCYRFILYSDRHVGDGLESIVVTKIVMPADAIPKAIALTAKALGTTLQCVCVPRELN